MPGRPYDVLSSIHAAYQLVVWGSERVAKLPRGHRFTVGQRPEGLMSRVLDNPAMRAVDGSKPVRSTVVS